jgi:hypothetical protein
MKKYIFLIAITACMSMQSVSTNIPTKDVPAGSFFTDHNPNPHHIIPHGKFPKLPYQRHVYHGVTFHPAPSLQYLCMLYTFCVLFTPQQ